MGITERKYQNLLIFASAMRKKILYALQIAVMVLSMTACNNDIFIKRLLLSTDYAKLGPDCMTSQIKVTGEDWDVFNVCFYGDGESVACPPASDGIYHIETAFADLYLRKGSGDVSIELIGYEGLSPAVLTFAIADEYVRKEIAVDILPTGKFDIEIEDISYILYSWGGYPDEDYSKTLIAYSYPQGLSEAASFAFPEVVSLPVSYYFEGFGDDVFVQRVLDSGISVPIPSYTFHSSPTHDTWSMAGEKADLTTKRTSIRTAFVPPMPPAVELPAATPLAVRLLCDYESVSLSCTIKASDVTTGKEVTFDCRLRMNVPVRLKTEVITE